MYRETVVAIVCGAVSLVCILILVFVSLPPALIMILAGLAFALSLPALGELLWWLNYG